MHHFYRGYNNLQSERILINWQAKNYINNIDRDYMSSLNNNQYIPSTILEPR